MVSELSNLLIFPRGRQEKNPPEGDPTPVVKDKNAKTFFINSKAEVLILRRSPKEDSRVGEGDIPGGKFEEGDTDPRAVAIEEATQELPGIQIVHLEPIYRHIPTTPSDGVLWRSNFFAGIAEFPDGITTSEEHDYHLWLPKDALSIIRLPDKYMTALEVGSSVLDRLVDLQLTDNVHLLQNVGRSAMEIDEQLLQAA